MEKPRIIESLTDKLTEVSHKIGAIVLAELERWDDAHSFDMDYEDINNNENESK